MTLNDRWLLTRPGIHTVTLGAARPEDFDLHLLAADNNAPLTGPESAAIARWDAQIPNVLRDDACTVCGQCLPCPQRVNIPEVLRLRNLACAFDMTDYGQYRYNLIDGCDDWFYGLKGHRCTECGQCLPRCPENLDIPRLLFDAHDRLGGAPGSRLWD